MGLEVRAELLLDGAGARGMCQREGVATTRHLSTNSFFWLQHLVTSGVAMVGVFASAESCADLETKPLPVHRLRS